MGFRLNPLHGTGLVPTGSSGGGGGSGDVNGPASSTDNAVARFDGTTGKVIQNSGATIDDAGNLTATNISGTNTGNVTVSDTSTIDLTLTGQLLSADVVAGSITDTELSTGLNSEIDGKVTGPASATDNAIVRYDGTTGKLVKDGVVIVDDAGLISNVADPSSPQDAATKNYVDSEIAGTGDIRSDGTVSFTANQSMGGFKLTDLDDPTNPGDAVNLNYADANFGDIKSDGSVAFTADQSMGNNKLTDVTDPTNPQDAATKAYVDSSISAPTLVISSITADPTLVSGDKGKLYLADTSGAAFSMQLPNPSTVGSGFYFYVKDKTGSFGTNNLTILRFSSEKIENVVSNKILSANFIYKKIFTNGTDWWVS